MRYPFFFIPKLGRRQAIFWTNTGMLLIIPIETNFSDILIEIHAISFKKMQENALENALWKTTANLSRPQSVKTIASKVGRSP